MCDSSKLVMETAVPHVSPSNCNKKPADATGGAEGDMPGATTTADVTATTVTAAKVTTPMSSCSNISVSKHSNSSATNPIFVITNSSLSSSSSEAREGGGIVPPSNNYEMPSTSTSSCVGETVVSSSSAAPCSSSGGGGAHSEEDEGGGGAEVNPSAGAITTTAPVSSASATTSSSRPSNPRQSTLTRSHAITLDEDSDSGATTAIEVVGKKPLQLDQEQELITFVIDTCNKSAKDKNFILRIEADLLQFVKDETRQTLPFPQMTSYQRMLVHRMATLFDLDHNVDNSSGGNFVVVSKDLSGSGHGGRIPPVRFKELQAISATSSNPAMIVSTSSSHLNISSLEHNSATASSQEDLAPASSTATSKKILKREKAASSGADNKKGGVAGISKTKSLEERTQDYHKARRRIFEDSCDSPTGMSLENSNSTSSKKLNWSSTDSSEDRMYLKPPFPASGKLIKVESFESASQKRSSTRDSRQMGKSHSFGGYEDSQQHSSCSSRGGSRGGGGGGANVSSNNASSSMISCSSSSSLRSSSFSKQDSSSSTTSGSGQSPSGATSSGSTSGYKSGSSACGGGPPTNVPGYFVTPSGGMGLVPSGANTVGATATHLGPVSMQGAGDAMKSAPAIIFAPASHSPQQMPPVMMQQTEEAMSPPTSSSAPLTNSSQPVLFCCWAVTDLNNVPPGAVIIDPNSGQSVKNSDGSHYYYDPSNPPKLIQTVSSSQPHPTGMSQQDSYQAPGVSVSTMYPQAILTGPSISGYTTAPQQQPPQTPNGGSGSIQPTAYMTIPTAGGISGSSQVYFSAPAQVSGTGQDIQDLSGYFSQLSAQSGVRQPAPPSVIYVPVDALGAAADQQQSQVGYYEDIPPQQQQPQCQQLQSLSQIPVQHHSPSGTGYVLQPIMDTSSGAQTGGVYYYGGNFVQAQSTPAVTVSSSSNVPQKHQRFKNWIGFHQQHPPHQHPFGIHGLSSQVPPPLTSTHAHHPSQQPHLPHPGAPTGTIMVHPNPNGPPTSSMVSAGPTGLVSILPQPGHLTTSQPQQSQQSQSGLPAPPAQVQPNAALLPLSYHHQPSGSTQPIVQTLVPCMQSPCYPPPSPAQARQPQSFVPPHHVSHSHHHQQQSNSPSNPRHQHPNHPHQPRFLAVTSQQQIQQQQQQQLQLQFLANAAAAAMMSNNYNFATGAAATSPVSGVRPPNVTGVVRRSRNFPTTKPQQSSSK